MATALEKRLSPNEYLQRFKTILPPKPRELYTDVVSLKVLRAVVWACRGGGKTWTGSLIQTSLYDMGFDWFNVGGSATQAKKCYNRSQDIINSDTMLKRRTIKSIQSETKSIFGNTMSVASASEKQIRGVHVGTITRGGGLSLDEEDEMDSAIVKSVLPVANTAHPSIILRLSTGHRADGTFKKILDNYKRFGYKLYHWDCFDICEKCMDKCSECFPEFRAKYCKGKAHKNEFGWMAVSEIKQLWIECEENTEWFESELMAWGIIIGNVIYREKDITKCYGETEYQSGLYTVLGIDWGFLEDRLCLLLMQYKGHERHIIDVQYLSGYDDYIAEINKIHAATPITEIFADSSHKFNNREILLRTGIKVNEVVFGTQKETGISNVKNGLVHGWYKIPERFSVFISQLKNYSRDKNGKAKKVNDHGCDALLCASEPVKPDIDLEAINEQRAEDEAEVYEDDERVTID